MKAFKRNSLTPPQILVVGFLVMIFMGAFLLSLPIASKNGKGLNFLDAFFTATSATCVTGLIVVDTGKFFSVFGQCVIAFLIQVGGLGFMTMSILVALALGKRIMLRERLIMQEALNQFNIEGIVRITKFLTAFTFVTEGLAAIILWVRWIQDLGVSKALYYGIFHSISAFCNAGFDLFSVSLVNYRGDVLINAVFSLLIIIGGIGLAVLVELQNSFYNRKVKFTLHTKMVLVISFILLVLGTIAIFLLEGENTLAGLPVHEKILASFFQSVVPRTAGFNSLPIGDFRNGTLFFMMMLMFIGASPGSTGGGIKTTTFGVVSALIFSIIKGKKEVEVFERTIPQDTVFKALTVLLISLGLVVAATMVLLITEQASVIQIMFEVVSAFGTVGLSTGITPDLSWFGKLVIMFTMFLGRVGPLTLTFALTEQARKHSQIKFPEERISVG